MYMRPIYLLALLFLFFGCNADTQEGEQGEALYVRWGLIENQSEGPEEYQEAYFIIDDPNGELVGEWAIHFNAFIGQITSLNPAYQLENITGTYHRVVPTEAYQPTVGPDTFTYRSTALTRKAVMSPGGMFLVKEGKATSIDWSRDPMTAAATFTGMDRPGITDYDDPEMLFNKYSDAAANAAADHGIVPTPAEISLLGDPLNLGAYDPTGGTRLHLWYSGALWSSPMNVFGDWLESFYGIELVRHGEEKPDMPHLELIYDTNLAEEAYEIFNMGPEVTVISAGSAAGMQYGLSTVLQSLRIDDNQLSLPIERVVDQPRFGYRGQMLDVSRNFHSKASVLKLLDLMALFKYNKFHFHLTDDEGWRLEIPGIPELTSIGGTRGYTPDESDRLNPSYGSGPSGEDPYGTGFYSVDDFVEILRYAKERHIEVIPEFDLPGHARAAIKALEAYAKRTGDNSYALSEPEDASVYKSVQDYPDNTINVCQESTYKFLDKVVAETQIMFDSAGVELKTLHTGGDEVPGGVWTASPSCAAWLAEARVDDENPETVKNALSAYFLQRFSQILTDRGIRIAGWEEIAMEREADSQGNYRYVVNPNLTDARLLPYVWNSLGDNLTLAYELANAGYEVIICNVTNLYFDLAYSTDPDEPGLYWGGFVDTYSPWAIAPFDMAKTAPSPWYQEVPTTEAEWRARTVALQPGAQRNVLGLQGQLWSETVRGADMQEYYLWPKMLGLAERAWSPAANWEATVDPEQRATEMASDWSTFTTRLGNQALPLLDRYAGDEGVNYRLPPPGGKIENGQLIAKTGFPGLPIYYRLDGGNEERYEGPVSVPADARVTISTGASMGNRRSKEIVVR